MGPRELIALLAATLTTLSVATVAVASPAASIDGGGGADESAADAALVHGFDYDATQEIAEDDDNEDAANTSSSSDSNAADNNQQQQHHHRREVRCYCNQPHCVSQGYMCRGRGCFTELPLTTRQQQLIAQLGGRAEHAAYSGCLERSFAERPCPPGKLCCEQDLCNHVDSPAMRSRLNKTLQVLLGEHRMYFGSVQPAGQEEAQPSDGWFRTATIAVPICGFVVLLILASLAIRLLQPLPSQGDKLNGLRMPESAPPLLGPPSSKMPLV